MIDFNDLERNLTPNLFQNRPFGVIDSDELSIGELVSRLLPYIFLIAGLLFLVYIIVGGISLMTSAGDPKAMQSAKAKLTHGAIGFLIVFMSFWIVQIIVNVLGLSDRIDIFR